MKLLVANLGSMAYLSAYDLQRKLNRLRQRDAVGDMLLLLEHPPVITIGTGGKEDNILVNGAYLRRAGIDVYRTNRGGDVTYHGPGQIVGYPILDLTAYGKDVRNYVRRLEETFICLLAEEYGLHATRDCAHPGVWVGNAKIAALGCAVKRWITMHGFAFNVNTDLEYFRLINPCGITDRGVTSLQKLRGAPQDMALARRQVISHFARVFRREPEIITPEGFLRKIEEAADGQSEAGLA